MKHFLPIIALLLLPSLHSAVVKQVLNSQADLKSVPLENVAWKAWEDGYVATDEGFVCDNGNDAKLRRGLGKLVVLNQKRPLAIRVTAESKAVNASTADESNYSLYLDISYADGTNEWGVKSSFTPGTHDWEEKEVVFMPGKPIESVNCWLLFREHSGKAVFRNLKFYQAPFDPNGASFDGVAVINQRSANGWIIRDVKQNTPFVTIEDGKALGININTHTTFANDARIHHAELSAPGLKEDRILHLAYVMTLPDDKWQWLSFARQPKPSTSGEYMFSSNTGCGAAGHNGTQPIAAVGNGPYGMAAGIDLNTPAHGRAVFNADTHELFVAFDIALTPENNTAKVKAFAFSFTNKKGLRSAFAKLYTAYPEAFKVRIKKQGLWMAFANISEVEGFEDFGFAVKEGTTETKWDDDHGILTFRYTEPMTWWMRMPNEMDKTFDNAIAEARRLAETGKPVEARTFASSVYHDKYGRPVARIRNEPWCNGAVWSMNSMPGIKGEFTDFNIKWNDDIKKRLYGPDAKFVLDGEYIDSSEGYVTDLMDFNRAHFAAAQTPLAYDSRTLKPCIFRGLVSYEYVRAIERDMHGIGKLMMANSTPHNLWYLAPLLDYLGTEHNWNYRRKWQPPSDTELLSRRALCGGKPYCFLQNTNFEYFPHEMVELYMKRTLFYGFYPSFFSADAATKHYFKNPALYNRDRDLFKKYVPLCKLVGEAGWRPETMAHAADANLWLEQFGDRYITVFNATDKPITSSVTIEFPCKSAIDRVTGKTYTAENNALAITLASEDVMLLEIQ